MPAKRTQKSPYRAYPYPPYRRRYPYPYPYRYPYRYPYPPRYPKPRAHAERNVAHSKNIVPLGDNFNPAVGWY